MTDLRATLSIVSDDPDTIVRAVELMTRAATGLALEGVETTVLIAPEEGDDLEVDLDDPEDIDE